MIKSNQKEYISRLHNGEGMIRIGTIWFGKDDLSTATSIYYFGNKKIQTVVPIRTESALSFSNSTPPVDTLQVEIVVKAGGYKEYIQKFFAQLHVARVLPVINPTIAAITMPVQLNKDIYAAYGYSDIVTNHDILNSVKEEHDDSMFKMYCSVPVQMRVDQIMMSTMRGNPGSYRMLITLTRALTANTYGEKVEYVKTFKESLDQEQYLYKYREYGGDDPKTKAIGKMVGFPVSKYSYIIDSLKSATAIKPGMSSQGGEYTITEVLSATLYRAIDPNGKEILVAPFGVETFMSEKVAELFGIEYSDCYTNTPAILELITALTNHYTNIFKAGNNKIKVTPVETAGMSYFDGILNQSEYPKVIYGIVDCYLGNINNLLILRGDAFHESPTYSSYRISKDIEAKRDEAISGFVSNMYELDIKGNILKYSITQYISNDNVGYPWIMRKKLRSNSLKQKDR